MTGCESEEKAFLRGIVDGANENLPQQLDRITVMEGVEYDGRYVTYYAKILEKVVFSENILKNVGKGIVMQQKAFDSSVCSLSEKETFEKCVVNGSDDCDGVSALCQQALALDSFKEAVKNNNALIRYIYEDPEGHAGVVFFTPEYQLLNVEILKDGSAPKYKKRS